MTTLTTLTALACLALALSFARYAHTLRDAYDDRRAMVDTLRDMNDALTVERDALAYRLAKTDAVCDYWHTQAVNAYDARRTAERDARTAQAETARVTAHRDYWQKAARLALALADN